MPTLRKDVRNGFQDVRLAWEHLKKTEEDLVCCRSLSKTDSKRHTEVIANSGKPARNKYDRKYYLFLNMVEKAWYELCIIAFSRYQIDSTKKDVLSSLAKKTREKRGDIDPRVQSFFADLKKPKAVQACRESSQESASTSKSWYEFTHAELEGTISMFGEVMAKGIKEVQMDQDWKAVTMHFPKETTPENSFTCFLKLEVREEYLKELTMALFKMEVSWVTHTFQIVHENGMMQTMSEFVHKGALEEDIVAVFDPEISSAITECTVRRRELAEGKRRTGCVSIAFARSEGTVTLAMDLQRGVEIQKKLYTKNDA